MIRFIDCSGQITLEDNDFWFAFYDTTIDQFISFDDSCVWDSWDAFDNDYRAHYDGCIENGSRSLSRFKDLFPPKYKNKIRSSNQGGTKEC